MDKAATIQQLIADGVALLKQGRSQQAKPHFEQALQLNEVNADALNMLSVIELSQKNYNQAKEYLFKLLLVDPDMSVTVFNNLGVCYQNLQEHPVAAACYENALKINPEHADSQKNLVQIYRKHWPTETPSEYCERLERLALNGRLAEDDHYWVKLAEGWRHQGRIDKAIHCCQMAIDRGFNTAQSQTHLGFYKYLEHKANSQKEAEEAYQAAIKIDPEYFWAYRSYGNLLYTQRRYAQAEEIIRKGIEINSQDSGAWANLANVCTQRGRLNEAIAYYRKAEILDPNDPLPCSAHLFALNYAPNITAKQLFEQAKKAGELHSKSAKFQYQSWLSDKVDQPIERLKIGFVSPDLRSHAVGYFLENILKEVSKSEFEWYAFSILDEDDSISKSLKQQMNGGWHVITGMSHEVIAKKIHDLGIHILIDLAGYTANNRLGMFAYKPAPIQVSWLGWFATTGLPQMDYFLSDEISVRGIEAFFSEKITLLPHTRLCMTPPSNNLPVAELPALKKGHLNFGCIQNLAKITDDTLKTWGKILTAIPNATLQMQAKQFNQPEACELLRSRAKNAGMDVNRLTLLPPMSREKYLQAMDDVDIFLDTYPYPGGTTTAEGLWMGIPTLTLMGDTLISRQGGSLLQAAGLPDWITYTEQDYIGLAVAWSQRIDELAQLRRNLRARVAQSPLFDAQKFARDFERTLMQLWQEHRSSNHSATI